MSFEKITDEIAKQGLLGILLILALLVAWYLYKQGAKLQSECNGLQTDRIADWKEISETVKANSVVMRDWVAANEGRTRALEATARAQELAAQSHMALANEVKALSEVIKDARANSRSDIRELRDAVLSRGG